MTLDNIFLINEAKIKVVLKDDKKIPADLLKKINETGLKGMELTNLKKTIIMQLDSGIPENKLYSLIKDYMKLANYMHSKGKQLI